MKFTFENKEYDTDNISDKGKLYVGKLQKIANDQQILSSQFEDNTFLQGKYTELLKAELPKEDKKEEVKKD
jgi:hypothetical protein